jgi:hypothetical protein
LRFKLDFWLKSIKAQLKTSELQNPRTKTHNSPSNDTLTDKKIFEQPGYKFGPALDFEDDIWILKNETDCKRVISRWLVKIMGPSPYVGQWVETDKPNVWSFQIQSSVKKFFSQKDGVWNFSGDQKPDFIWKENLWLMTGEHFELFFRDGSQVHYRLKLKDKVFSIAENSEYAKTKKQKIIESFDKELVIKKEAPAVESKKNIENTADLLTSHMEGSGRTDQLKNGPLSGKTKTNQMINDMLAGHGSTDKLPGHLKNALYGSQPQPKAGNLLAFDNSGESINPGVQLEADIMQTMTATAKVFSFLTQDKRKVSCELDDHFDNIIIFKTKNDGIQNAQAVVLDLCFQYLGKETKLNFLGSVTAIDIVDAYQKYISVKINDKDVKSFAIFMQLYQARQKNVDFFFQHAKGF